MMNLYLSKIYVFLLLTICRLISGLSPLFICKKFKRKYGLENIAKTWVEKSVACSMDFSGGILLATCFIHMIPEVRHHLLETLKNDYRFPYTETLVCVGFFIVFIIEESVKHVAKTKSHPDIKKTGVLIPMKVSKTRSGTKINVRNEDDPEKEMPVDINGDSINNGISCAVAINTSLMEEMNSIIKDEFSECNNNTKTNKTVHNLKSFLLISALCFHSVMEGLAIGLAQDTEDVWYLFLAVAVHECTILFCVGIELVINSPLPTVLTYMAVFALVSPAGVMFGTLFTLNVSDGESSPFQSVMVSSLQGLAAGTILYVTFFEVLNNREHHHHHHHHHHDEIHDSRSGLPKLVFIALGFIFMVALELIGGHENNTLHCFLQENTWNNKSSS